METTRQEIEERNGVWITEDGAAQIMGREWVQAHKDAFTDYRYPQDWRDENPIPEGWEEDLTITCYVLERPREVVAQVSDRDGHGDGTGLFYA